MNTQEILEGIDAEIAKLQQVRVLLLQATEIKRSVGRPKKSVVALQALAIKPKKRVMSAEGKARIAAAQKKRWAAKKTSTKKAAKRVA